MNEMRTGSAIRQALDESTDRLPWRLTHRLESARKLALDRLPEERQAASVARPIPAGAAMVLTGAGMLGAGAGFDLSSDRPSFGWRAVIIGASLAVLIVGWFGVAQLESAREAAELDELESALLDDQVPIAGFADRGFGAFLRGVAPVGR